MDKNIFERELMFGYIDGRGVSYEFKNHREVPVKLVWRDYQVIVRADKKKNSYVRWDDLSGFTLSRNVWVIPESTKKLTEPGAVFWSAYRRLSAMGVPVGDGAQQIIDLVDAAEHGYKLYKDLRNLYGREHPEIKKMMSLLEKLWSDLVGHYDRVMAEKEPMMTAEYLKNMAFQKFSDAGKVYADSENIRKSADKIMTVAKRKAKEAHNDE